MGPEMGLYARAGMWYTVIGWLFDIGDEMRSTLDALNAELWDAVDQKQKAALAFGKTDGLVDFLGSSAASQDLSAAERRVAEVQQRIADYKASRPSL